MIYIVEGDIGTYNVEERYTNEIYAHNAMLLKKYYRIRHMEGLSVYTLDNYMGYLRVLSRYVGKRFEDMNTKNIRDFLIDYQKERNTSNYTLDGLRISIKVFFQFLVDEGYMLRNPAVKIKKIKYENTIKLPFTDEELIKLKDACKDIRETVIIDLLYSSGCRVSEICGLDIDDIDLINREMIVYGKGSKERIAYFDACTKVHMEKYLSQRKDGKSALFVIDKAPYNRIKRSGIAWIVKEIGKRAGVDHVHPHRFRRTIATRLLEKGMPVEEVQKLLGHIKIDTTLRYAIVNSASVKSNHRKLLA